MIPIVIDQSHQQFAILSPWDDRVLIEIDQIKYPSLAFYFQTIKARIPIEEWHKKRKKIMKKAFKQILTPDLMLKLHQTGQHDLIISPTGELAPESDEHIYSQIVMNIREQLPPLKQNIIYQPPSIVRERSITEEEDELIKLIELEPRYFLPFEYKRRLHYWLTRIPEFKDEKTLHFHACMRWIAHLDSERKLYLLPLEQIDHLLTCYLVYLEMHPDLIHFEPNYPYTDCEFHIRTLLKTIHPFSKIQKRIDAYQKKKPNWFKGTAHQILTRLFQNYCN